MYFLIGIWGGPRKEYAAIKFFLYTLVGSIGLLIVLIGTYLYSRGMPGHRTGRSTWSASPARRPGEALARSSALDRRRRQDVLRPADDRLPDQGAGRAVPHVAAGRARRGPDADQHDPGRHPAEDGRLRHLPHRLPALPEAAKELWLLIAIDRRGQHHLRRAVRDEPDRLQEARRVLVASRTWASSSLGAAMMTDAAVNGALFMMVAHGITSAMMFFVVGVVYERAHHRELSPLRRPRDDDAGLHRLLAPSPASPTSACPGCAGSSAR